MKLTKIHKILQFKQSEWMKICFDFNTKKKTNAVNSLEKDIFKLIINSVFYKIMENLRKRVIVKTVNNEKDCLKHTSKPTFIFPNILKLCSYL